MFFLHFKQKIITSSAEERKREVKKVEEEEEDEEEGEDDGDDFYEYQRIFVLFYFLNREIILLGKHNQLMHSSNCLITFNVDITSSIVKVIIFRGKT